MALTKVLVTVKTYPTLSCKYEELVCTAGFREDGSWVRIYPIQFRKKSYDQQYKKYDWIEIDLIKNESDFRPESYRPVAYNSEIKILDHIETSNNWAERKKIVLGKVYYNLTELIAEAKNRDICTSLAVFKPSKILDFIIEEDEREWDKRKLAKLDAERRQGNLFQQPENPFKIVRKLPYKFSYIFLTEDGIERKLMIEDWELGMLYWNCLSIANGDENLACKKVKERYLDYMVNQRDLYFFMGTTKQFHNVAPDPFIIVGAFYPPINNTQQLSLF